MPACVCALRFACLGRLPVLGPLEQLWRGNQCLPRVLSFKPVGIEVLSLYKNGFCLIDEMIGDLRLLRRLGILEA